MPFPTPEQLQSSTKGKRDNSDLSFAQEDGLQPSLKHARHLQINVYMYLSTVNEKNICMMDFCIYRHIMKNSF